MALCRRVGVMRRRGQPRRALLMLRNAAYTDENDAKLWTLYGAACARMGRRDAARQAWGHAVWLRDRDRDPVRADVTRGLIDGLDVSVDQTG